MLCTKVYLLCWHLAIRSYVCSMFLICLKITNYVYAHDLRCQSTSKQLPAKT